jgi:hypothetical protein
VTYDGPPDQLAEGGTAHAHHHDEHDQRGDAGRVPPMHAPLEGDR